MMSPTHLLSGVRSLMRGSRSDSNASWRRWTKAVDRMTPSRNDIDIHRTCEDEKYHEPVPKCLPMKKTMGGIRRNDTRLESAGNADAVHHRSELTQSS